MATINDVAKYAGVSKSTVSNVVGKKKYVSEEIVSRVMEACEKLNYVPSFTATTLVTKKTGIIGLFLGTEKRYDEFYGELIKGVILKANEYNLKVLVYYSIDKEEMNTSLTVNKEPIDGAILLKPFVNDYRVGYMSHDHIPFVLIGNMSDDRNLCRVDVDNTKITYEITKRLLELGHQSFYYFTINPEFTVSSDRILGFKKALEQGGFPEQNGIIVETDHYGEKAIEYLERNFPAKPEKAAIIVPSDVVGKKVYGFLDSRGFNIGRSISVIALGGKNYAFDLRPQLTTVNVDYEIIGRQCVSLLQKQIEKEPIEQRTMLVDAEILFSDSCTDFR